MTRLFPYLSGCCLPSPSWAFFPLPSLHLSLTLPLFSFLSLLPNITHASKTVCPIHASLQSSREVLPNCRLTSPPGSPINTTKSLTPLTLSRVLQACPSPSVSVKSNTICPGTQARKQPPQTPFSLAFPIYLSFPTAHFSHRITPQVSQLVFDLCSFFPPQESQTHVTLRPKILEAPHYIKAYPQLRYQYLPNFPGCL